MTNKILGAMVLGCASLVGAASLKAQGADQDKQFLMTAAQSDYKAMTFSNLSLQKRS